MPQRMSRKGRRFLEREEGLVPFAYNDRPDDLANSTCTFGIGHAIHRGVCTRRDVALFGHRNQTAAERRLRVSQARALFRRDLRSFEAAAREIIGRVMLQHRFDAVISLMFNIGIGAFRSSTVARRIKARASLDLIAEGFRMWKRSGDDPDLLLPRRNREVRLYRTGRYN